MKKIVSFLGIVFSLSAISATQVSKEYVDRRDNEVLSHAHEYTDNSVRGLANETNIPTKVSQLQNDSEYATGSVTNGLIERANSYTDEETRKALVAAKNYTDNATNGQSKVMSVNGRTGNVVLSSVDVHARPDNWTPSAEEIGAQPTLVSGANIKTVNGNSLLGSGNIVIHGSDSAVDGAARPLPKYLHLLDFADTYPDDAAWYYAQPQDYGSCSARRLGGVLERNYDWKFNDMAEFVVRMSAGPGRFASVGVANVGTNLTEGVVTGGKWSRYYKCLPGHTVDGINENGVVAEVNVTVTNGVEMWRGSPATDGIHCLAAVRWVLDNATSAGMAASNLAARVYVPQGIGNFQYMIADSEGTWIVENGDTFQWEKSLFSRVFAPILTNLLIFPPPGADKPGTERWNALMDSTVSITNVWYTNAYRRETNPPWVSDLAEVVAYTNEIFDAWASHPKEYFRRTSSTSSTSSTFTWWQTVHTSIYDITNKVLRVAVQETDDWYVFAVPSVGAVESVNGKTGAVTLDAADVGAMGTNAWLHVGSHDMYNEGYFQALGDGYGVEGDDIRYIVQYGGVTDGIAGWYYGRTGDMYPAFRLTWPFGWGDGWTPEIIATSNMVEAVLNPVASRVTAAEDTISAWEHYWDGDDVRFTVTNYYGSADDPALYIEQKMPADDTHGTNWFKTVWDERTRLAPITNRLTQAEAAIATLDAAKADNGTWGYYDSHNGKVAPDGFVSVSAGGVILGNGQSWQKSFTVDGPEVWTLVGSATIVPSTSGVLRLEDTDGTTVFEVIKGGRVTRGATAEAIVAGDTVTITYTLSDAQSNPTIQYCTDLVTHEWANVSGDSSDPIHVVWNNEGDTYTATITLPDTKPEKMFFKASYEAGEDGYVKFNSPVDATPGLYVRQGNTRVKIVPVLSGTTSGSTVTWKVE